MITLESDKATMEVPSPADGVIRELRVKLDDTVSEGDVVAILEVSEAGSGEEPAADPGMQQKPGPKLKLSPNPRKPSRKPKLKSRIRPKTKLKLRQKKRPTSQLPLRPGNPHRSSALAGRKPSILQKSPMPARRSGICA